MALASVALLLACEPAWALEATPVTCAALPELVGSGPSKATPGEVLQLPSGTCATNLIVTNTAPFTLEGAAGGGTVLEPAKAKEAIIESPASVTFSLSALTLTEAREAPALELAGPSGAPAVSLTGNSFTDNTGRGAVFISQGVSGGEAVPAGATVISDNTFAGDTSSAGGGVFFSGPGALRLSGNSFSADSASFIGGGLIVNNFTATTNPVELIGNTFGGASTADGNTAQSEGAGAELGLVTGQPLTLTENTFANNRITGDATATAPRLGAGLAISESSAQGPFPVAQAHNVFSDNTIDETAAPGHSNLETGGAAEWIRGVTVRSTEDTFVGNRIAVNDGAPPEGGAVGAIASTELAGTPPEPAAFIGADDLFLGNSTVAGGWGGAIYVGGPDPNCQGSCPGSSLALDDSTVTNNSVEPGAGSEGGAIWGSPNDSLAVNNSIVFGDSPQPEIFGFGTTTFAFSDVCNETGGPAVQALAGNICANPQLAADGNETAASPTIDAGSNALVPAGLSADLAGEPRIGPARISCSGLEAARVDMGAFEYQGVGPLLACAPRIRRPRGSIGCKCRVPSPPAFTNVTQSSRRWREGVRLASISRRGRRPPLGTHFSFTLNQAAEVQFVFSQRVGGREFSKRTDEGVIRTCVAPTRKNRHRPACKRGVRRGSLSFAAHAGLNKVSFQGRISRRTKLPSGEYTVAITATNSVGRRSLPARLSFTIVK